MKNEIIEICKNSGIDVIGFCNLNNLEVPYEKYELQDKLGFKSSFQVGKITDKDLSDEKYSIYNTAIVIGVGYEKIDFKNKEKIYFSSCAHGVDYHIVLKDKMKFISNYLKVKNFVSKIFVDNNPLDERLLAYNAGIGFYGKNGLIINEKLGSCFYIGVILTDANIEGDKVIDNKCTNCGLCEKICPIKAINEYGILDSNKCLSYLTQKKNVNEEYYKYFDNCVYGCDKCINICPYNKNVKIGCDDGFCASEFLNMSEDEYNNKYKNNSSYWRGKKVIDRNINIYLNNLKKK